MKILALETSGKNGSAAVINDDGQVFLAVSNGEMSHLKDVISISEEAIKAAGIEKSEITHIAASVGPGSFTGIRIGVTTARTLAQFMGVPTVPVSSLEAMARNVIDVATETDCGVIISTINARRKQTYAGAWSVEGGKLHELCEQRQYMIDELLDAVRSKEPGERYFFVGDGIDAYSDIIAEKIVDGNYELAPENIRYQTARTVAELAIEKVKAGEDVPYEDLLPNYMRLSEAEQRLKAGTLSSKIKKQD